MRSSKFNKQSASNTKVQEMQIFNMVFISMTVYKFKIECVRVIDCNNIDYLIVRYNHLFIKKVKHKLMERQQNNEEETHLHTQLNNTQNLGYNSEQFVEFLSNSIEDMQFNDSDEQFPIDLALRQLSIQYNLLSKRNIKNQSNQVDGKKANPNRCSAGKSRNLYKFIIKLFRKHIHKYQQKMLDFKEEFQSLRMRLYEICRLSLSNHHYLGMADMKELFCDQSTYKLKVRSKIARLILKKILSKAMKHSVLLNNRCRQKTIHLNSLKIYKLRCCNPQLAYRLQYHKNSKIPLQ